MVFLIVGITLASASALWISSSNVAAQELGNGPGGVGFADENADGYNDNAPDADGDGIPNSQDPDYERLGDGGRRGGRGMRTGLVRGFVDEDGDGINDCALDSDGNGIRNCEDPEGTVKRGWRGSRGGRK